MALIDAPWSLRPARRDWMVAPATAPLHPPGTPISLSGTPSMIVIHCVTVTSRRESSIRAFVYSYQPSDASMPTILSIIVHSSSSRPKSYSELPGQPWSLVASILVRPRIPGGKAMRTMHQRWLAGVAAAMLCLSVYAGPANAAPQGRDGSPSDADALALEAAGLAGGGDPTGGLVTRPGLASHPDSAQRPCADGSNGRRVCIRITAPRKTGGRSASASSQVAIPPPTWCNPIGTA
jgi:hypothetical protein